MKKSQGILLLALFLLASFALSSCAAKKGCGCGNNLNYYKPSKKFRK